MRGMKGTRVTKGGMSLGNKIKRVLVHRMRLVGMGCWRAFGLSRQEQGGHWVQVYHEGMDRAVRAGAGGVRLGGPRLGDGPVGA